jgi:hypothetical protein
MGGIFNWHVLESNDSLSCLVGQIESAHMRLRWNYNMQSTAYCMNIRPYARIKCDAGAASKSMKFGRFWLSSTQPKDATRQVVCDTGSTLI